MSGAAKSKLHNYSQWTKEMGLEDYLEERKNDEGRTRCRGWSLEIRAVNWIPQGLEHFKDGEECTEEGDF